MSLFQISLASKRSIFPFYFCFKLRNFYKFSQVRFQSTEGSIENENKIPFKRGQIMSWRQFRILAGFGLIATTVMMYYRNQKLKKIEENKTKQLGKAALGGPWELLDHNGVLRKSDDFLGKWILIYFGFTHCPDVCPDEIEKIVQVIDLIDADNSMDNVEPLFITVDPSRDSIETVKKYVQEFSPRLLGFTGSSEQIAKATRAYRVYYSEGPKDSDNDYIVDHTIISYLVGPDGEFVDYFGQSKTVDEIKNSIALNMIKYKRNRSATS